MTDDAHTAPDQPAPTPQPDRPAIWPLVIADLHMFEIAHPPAAIEAARAAMVERDRIGRERYGTPLTSRNGRDHLIDAYQELLDATVYIRAEIDERGLQGDMPLVVAVVNGDDNYSLLVTYRYTVGLVIGMADQIARRAKVAP